MVQQSEPLEDIFLAALEPTPGVLEHIGADRDQPGANERGDERLKVMAFQRSALVAMERADGLVVIRASASSIACMTADSALVGPRKACTTQSAEAQLSHNPQGVPGSSSSPKCRTRCTMRQPCDCAKRAICSDCTSRCATCVS